MPTVNAQLERKSIPSRQPEPPATVAIEYCLPGNYETVARGLAADVRREFGIAVNLIPSRDGVFEVNVCGKLIFSKKATLRFPDRDEVFYHVRNRPQ